MKNYFIKLTAVIIILICPGTGFSETINWKVYDEGMSIAKAEDKKTLIHFRTDWCTYCKKMDASTFLNADIIQYLNENFITIKVDGDKETNTVNKYGVRGYPDNWFLTEEVERISHLPGYVDPERFLLVLKYINTDSFKKMPFQEFVQSQ